MRRVIVVDTETTGLDAEIHEIWEVGAIEIRAGGNVEHLWRIEPIRQLDAEALQVNGYHQRTARMRYDDRDPLGLHGMPYWSGARGVADALADLLEDATIVAAVPGFDERFMAALMRQHGISKPPWHYRVRDIQSMAHGYLAGLVRAGVLAYSQLPPLDAGTDDLAVCLGLDPADYDRHSALGDCRLEAEMLELITAGRESA
jgi:DNA polymerase III epsilon subunit-like protein